MLACKLQHTTNCVQLVTSNLVEQKEQILLIFNKIDNIIDISDPTSIKIEISMFKIGDIN
jgi:hypothetical protein